MIGTYFLAYVGSSNVIALPLNLVAPVKVSTTKVKMKIEIAKVIANLVSA